MSARGHQSGRSVALTAEHIAGFRARPVVVLSPHFDDACFSLGCFLERLNKATVINIFTRGDHLVSGSPGKTADEIYAIRDAEDRAFAEHCNIWREDLKGEEPSLSGRDPLDPEGIAADIAIIEKPLLKTLLDTAASWAPGQRGSLFAPLGIGRHANHRAVAEIVQTNLAKLQACYDIFLYEDLPYAYNPLRRSEALARVRAELTLGPRHTLAVSWRHKSALIEIYESQFLRAPVVLTFRPAALTPLGMHEAFWPVVLLQ